MMKRIALIALGLLLSSAAYAADNAVIVTPGTGVTMKSKDVGLGVQSMQHIISDTSGGTLATPAAGADTVSNSTEGLQTYNFPLMFNGTTWDRVRGDTTNGIWVNVKAGGAGGGIVTQATAANLNATVVGTGTFAVQAPITTWGGGTLGAMALYGTSPGAVLVPGINAFITNTPAVTLASTTITGTVAATESGVWTVQPGNTANTTPWLFQGNVSNAADTVATGSISAPSLAYNMMFNGTTWDRIRGDTTNGIWVNVKSGGAGGGIVIQATAANLNATVVGTGTFATQSASTLNAETTKVIGTVRALGNAGGVLDAIGKNVIAPANWLQAGCQFNTTPTTITSGNGSPCQVDNAGNLLVNIKAGSSSGAVAQGSTTSGQTGSLIQAAVTTASPTYTTAQTSPLSLDTTGALRVNVTAGGAGGGAVTNAGTFAVQDTVLDAAIVSQGTALGTIKLPMIGGSVTTAAPTYTTGQIDPLSLDTTGALRVNVTAGGAGGGIVTQATGSNLHVAVDSITGQNSNGQATMAVSAPVVIASNQSAVAVSDNASTPVTATLQTAAVVTGNGTTLNTNGMSSAILTVNVAPPATPVNSAFSTATTGGTLAAATYFYRVTATGATGETLASTETSQVTTGTTSTVTVNWGSVAGATGYNVYGRTTGAELKIATLGNVLTFVDTGSVTPSGALPAANTATGGATINFEGSEDNTN